jgi:anaphase-promoting complex subunit 2
VKILSRFFWPKLEDATYKLPFAVFQPMGKFQMEFESLKSSRTLTWLPHLGQATVELVLQDRVVVQEVHTWQAAIIDAFGSDEDGASVTRTIEYLMASLDMDEALVQAGLNFWVGKMVLQKVGEGEYAVLETLDGEGRDNSNVQAAAAAAADASAKDEALTSANAMTEERMTMYWHFIQGMLKNSAPQMPLPQIAQMLKMFISDGFPYSNEVLQEFLGRKVTAGELELVAGKYKLKT